MLKRIFIGIITIVFLTGMLFFLMNCNGDAYHPAEAAEAVPPDASIFIDKLDFSFFTEEFSDENIIWNELLKSDSFMEIDSLLQYFTGNLEKMPILSERLNKGSLSISLHLVGQNKILPLFYLSLGDNHSEDNFEAELKSILGKDVLINQRRYEAVDIYGVSLNNSNTIKSFSYGVKSGLLIASTSSLLVEDAIRSLNSGGGIMHQKEFKKVAGTAGKYVHANVYMNYPYLDRLFYPLIKSEFYKGLVPLKEFAEWGEFDLDIRENIIVLNGMSFADDSLKGWLNLFKGQLPVRLDAAAYIPSNVVDFISIGLSDVKLFKDRLLNELSLRDQLAAFQAREKELEKRIGISPFSELMDLLNDEIIKFRIDDGTGNAPEEVVIFEVISRSDTRERLENWVTRLASEKGMKLKDFTSDYVLDDHSKYAIYTLPEKLYRGVIPGSFIKGSFTIYDNYLIFSDSHNAISRTIYQNVLHKTLANEDYYNEVNSLISTKANLTFFFRPESYLAMQNEKFTKAFRDQLSLFEGTIRKFPGVIIQFANEDEMAYSNISLKYTSNIRERALTVWESLLDSQAIIKPVLVSNHNTSEKEIFVQSAKNSVCLLNSTGRILWKVKLDSPVISEIYQVDYYKNGKFQYLFNTKEAIYLLDRNGNNVERYPVKFRSDATNGIVMFDYDNRKDYRLFVACENRKVYAYDLEGNIIPGWSFSGTEGKVEKPIQHFRIRDMDYILISDPVRSYILDRRGSERIKIKEQKAISKNNGFYLDMNVPHDNPRFISTDEQGNVIGIDLKGNVDILMGYKANAEHFFRIMDLDQDGKPEYIFGNENTLEVINLTGKRLFSFKIKSDISTLPDVYEFSSIDLKIGLTDVEKNVIYLINSDGTLYEGFPLEGNTRFSIGYFAGSDSRFNLIVGSQNGFLYNYSIE